MILNKKEKINMSEKSLSKNIVSNYHSTIIPVCKLLKSHATNIMLLPDNKILMQPVINGIRNYMILNSKYDYSNFIYSFFSLPEISKINTKFRKTKSEVEWEVDNGTNYLIVKNPSEEMSCKVPIINNPDAIKDIINASYINIPNWNYADINDIICEESSSDYIKLPDSIIENMLEKKLCEITVDDRSILLSRPFLGDLKKTSYVGYRIISKEDDKLILKFKQSEEIGNIYTYAAFLTV